MQTFMAASFPSADSHHAAHISSDNTTVALVSYNVGILNDEVKSKRVGEDWRKVAEAHVRYPEDLQEPARHSDSVSL